MSDKNVIPLVSYLNPPPPCNVSVNKHDIDSITTEINNKANVTTKIVEKYIKWI